MVKAEISDTFAPVPTKSRRVTVVDARWTPETVEETPQGGIGVLGAGVPEVLQPEQPMIQDATLEEHEAQRQFEPSRVEEMTMDPEPGALSAEEIPVPGTPRGEQDDLPEVPMETRGSMPKRPVEAGEVKAK